MRFSPLTCLGAAAAALGLTLSLAAPPPALAAPATPPIVERALKDDAARSQAGIADKVRVIVMLKDQPASPSAATESANLASQNALLATWATTYGLQVDDQFGYLVNGLSGTMPADKMVALAADPAVASVRRERLYHPTEHVARDLEGVPAALKSHKADGTGSVIAVLDSGIDPSHPDLRLDDCGAAKIQEVNPSGGLFTCKVPNGYNYADESFEIRDLTESQHGQHVAGIAAANGSQGAEPDFETSRRIDGVAPNAQLLAMKVFSNDAHEHDARDSDIIAAIEDSVKMGADVINISLGGPNGVRDSSNGAWTAIERAREAGVLTVVAAGNEGLNFSPNQETQDLVGRFDDGTVGDPAVHGSALTVASLDNTRVTAPHGTLGGGDGALRFAYQLGSGTTLTGSHPLVHVGLGRAEDYAAGADLTGAVALAERGENAYADKIAQAQARGAVGVLVYNSEEGGELFPGMGGLEDVTLFSGSLRRSEGLALRDALAAKPAQQVAFDARVEMDDLPTGLTPSAYTSWGATQNLDFEPEIAGIGGQVYSTVGTSGYDTKSGTSMAAPNVSGMSALLLHDLATRSPGMPAAERIDLAKTLLMNTAAIPSTTAGTPAAPRQVGAGLAQIDKALDTPVTATVDGSPSVALREVSAPRTFTVTLTNRGDADATYTVPAQQVITETNAAGEATSTLVSSETLSASAEAVTVPAGGTATVDFTLSPDTASTHFIEGWAKLASSTGAPDLVVPYLGFVGDWNAESIIQPAGQTWGPGAVEDTTALVGPMPSSVLPFDDGKGTVRAMSPNGDGHLDSAIPSLLLMRNARTIRYSVLDSAGNQVIDLGDDENISRYIGGVDEEGKAILGADGTVNVTGRVTDDRAKPSGMTLTMNGQSVTINDDGTFTLAASVDGETNYLGFVASDGANTGYKVVPIKGRGETRSEATVAISNGECSPAGNCYLTSANTDRTADGVFNARGTTSGGVASIDFIPASRATEDGKLTEGTPISATMADDDTFTVPLPAPMGMSTFRMVARDAAGKVVVESLINLYVDIKPPSIDFTEPVLYGGELYTSADSVDFKGTISDDGWGYKLRLNNEMAADFHRYNNPGAKVNKRDFAESLAVKDGDTILVDATDEVYNAVRATIPVHVDKEAPGATLSGVKDGEVIRDRRELSATATDSHLASLEVSVDGKALGSASTARAKQRTDVEAVLAPVGRPQADDDGHDDGHGHAHGRAEAAAGAGGTEAAEAAEGAAAGGAGGGAAAARDAGAGGAAGDAAAAGAGEAAPGTPFAEATDSADAGSLSIPVPTADMTAGAHVVVVTATDLAGNTTTATTPVVVDADAVINGPDSATVTVDRGALADQAAVAAKVLENYSVTDDGSATAAGDMTLSLAPNTVLTEGANAVTLVVTDAAGRVVTRQVTITIAFQEQPPSGDGSGDGSGGGSGDGSGPGVRPSQPGQMPVPLPGPGVSEDAGLPATGRPPMNAGKVASTGADVPGMLGLAAAAALAGAALV